MALDALCFGAHPDDIELSCGGLAARLAANGHSVGLVDLTRGERANNARSKPGYFDKYGEAARKVLDALVAKFADDGYATLDKVLDDGQLVNFLSSPPFSEFGRPLEVVRAFGGKDQFRAAMRELQQVIYQD